MRKLLLAALLLASTALAAGCGQSYGSAAPSAGCASCMHGR